MRLSFNVLASFKLKNNQHSLMNDFELPPGFRFEFREVRQSVYACIENRRTKTKETKKTIGAGLCNKMFGRLFCSRLYLLRIRLQTHAEKLEQIQYVVIFELSSIVSNKISSRVLVFYSKSLCCIFIRNLFKRKHASFDQ